MLTAKEASRISNLEEMNLRISLKITSLEFELSKNLGSIDQIKAKAKLREENKQKPVNLEERAQASQEAKTNHQQQFDQFKNSSISALERLKAAKEAYQKGQDPIN